MEHTLNEYLLQDLKLKLIRNSTVILSLLENLRHRITEDCDPLFVPVIKKTIPKTLKRGGRQEIKERRVIRLMYI